MRNGRKDKFTTCGYLTRVQSRNISFLLAFLGLVSLAPTNIFVFSLGLYYVILFIFYSNPIKRLKGSVKGYATLSSTFLLLPFALGTLSGGTAPFLPVFSSFYFFQFMYILCQKDSTDTKDRTNMFIVHGWGRSVKITALFSSLASVFLFSISIANPAFIVFWLVNLYAKFSNVNSIRLKAITKRKRYRLMLIEFLTPYLYLGGGML
jgi:4-hydroxybenzoate polyprenyltransferase